MFNAIIGVLTLYATCFISNGLISNRVKLFQKLVICWVLTPGMQTDYLVIKDVTQNDGLN